MNKLNILILVFILIGKSLSAQTPANCAPYSSNTKTEQACQNGNGISTDPKNLKNNDCPNLKNDFEWKVKHQPGSAVPNEYYVAYDENGMVKGLRNPFNDPDNSDYRYLAGNHNSNYYPEDGWEMLKVDFAAFSNFKTGFSVAAIDQPGFNSVNGGKKLPYMILYNKYAGTFRFFGALLNQYQDYSTIKIELRIPKISPKAGPTGESTYQSDLKSTNLLSIQGESIQPLDQETNENVMIVFATATNNESKFFWFDIPVAYDPCLCNMRSQLDITFSFVKTADIKLNEVTEAVKTEIKPNNFEYGQKAISRVIAAGFATATAIASGGTIINIKAYTDLINLIKTNPKSNLSQDDKDKLTVLENYIDCGGTFAQIIQDNYSDLNNKDIIKSGKAAVGIMEGNATFLTSLSNGCNKNDNAATAITGAMAFSGTFTETSKIGNTEIKMAIPGSNWSDKKMQINSYLDDNSKTVPSYPIYNERLGVFAMLETPSVEMATITEEKSYSSGIVAYDKLLVSMKLKENLKFAFNPIVNPDLDKTIISCRYVGINPSAYNIKFVNPSPFYIVDRSDVINCRFKKEIDGLTALNVNINESQQNQMYSPFVPIEQFNDLKIVFYLDHKNSSNSDGTNNSHIDPSLINKFVFVQFKITMTSKNIGKDGKNISAIYYFTYPIKLSNQFLRAPRVINSDLPITTPTDFHSCDDFYAYLANTYLPSIRDKFQNNIKNIVIENKNFNSDVTFQKTEDFIYDGIVTISAKLSTTAGKKVKIYSTLGFDITPGAEISPYIELIVGLPLQKVPQPPQNYSQVSTFCSSNKYKAKIFSQDAVKFEKEAYEAQISLQKVNDDKQINPLTFKIAPNPNTGKFNISVFNNNEPNYSISLMDVTGKVLLDNKYDGKFNTQLIETNGLAPGIYFVKISCGNSQKTEKLIITSN